MTEKAIFPTLEGFEPTRQTLQLYSRVAAAVPRAHGEFHPKWWHVSLKVEPDGIVTDEVDLPGAGTCRLKLDLVEHRIILTANGITVNTFDMTEGKSSTALAGDVFAAVSGLGFSSEYDRSKFENDDPREYDKTLVGNFLTALVSADRIFKQHRATLNGDKGPVQLCPHGFDLAFEWFGSRVEVSEAHGDRQEYGSQLNLGFSPGSLGGAPYFYSNPWPFEADALLTHALPRGASWHTEGWQGTILPYEDLVGDPSAEKRLLTYARRVFELSSPTLTTDWLAASSKV